MEHPVAADAEDAPDLTPPPAEPLPAEPLPAGRLPVSLLPAGPHERLVQVACGVGLLLQSVRYYVTLPLLGYLLTRPLRYLAIHPSTVALVIGGAYARTGRDPLWAVLLVGLVSLAVVDPLRWLAGRRYGDRVARLLVGGNQGIVDRVERFTARWGTWGLVLLWFTPVPAILAQVAAGTAGMSLRRFLLADTAGVALWVGSVVGLGYALGEPAVRTVKQISHYSLWVTLGAIALAVVVGAVRGARSGAR